MYYRYFIKGMGGMQYFLTKTTVFFHGTIDCDLKVCTRRADLESNIAGSTLHLVGSDVKESLEERQGLS